MASKAIHKKSSSSKQKSQPQIAEQERHRMVAEAAYFNAVHRGFQGGDPARDWYLAEKQIEQQLSS